MGGVNKLVPRQDDLLDEYIALSIELHLQGQFIQDEIVREVEHLQMLVVVQLSKEVIHTLECDLILTAL